MYILYTLQILHKHVGDISGQQMADTKHGVVVQEVQEVQEVHLLGAGGAGGCGVSKGVSHLLKLTSLHYTIVHYVNTILHNTNCTTGKVSGLSSVKVSCKPTCQGCSALHCTALQHIAV